MKSITIAPMTGIAMAAVLTAATITGTGVQQAAVSAPALRVEMAEVQLQALAVTMDPVQMVTDLVKNVVTFAASAVWFAAFPITLPLSVVGGLVASVVANVTHTQTAAANDPLIGVTFFFAAPNILLTNGITNMGLSHNVIQQQQLMPFTMAATPRAAASRKQPADVSGPAAARSAKKTAQVAAKRSAGSSRHTS